MSDKIIFSEEKKENKNTNLLFKKYPGFLTRVLIFTVAGFVLTLGIFIFVSLRINSSLLVPTFILLAVIIMPASVFLGFSKKDSRFVSDGFFFSFFAIALIIIAFYIFGNPQ